MLTRRRGALGPAETTLLRRWVLASAGLHEEPLEDESIDWRLLLQAAERHRLAPLALEGAQRAGELARVPVTVLDRLKHLRNLELAKSVVRLTRLDQLAALARRKDWDLWVLKGAAFATTLYESPHARPMSDIDVLVEPRRFEDWSRELSALGYARIDSSDHASCHRCSRSGVLVEVHRSLTTASSHLGLDTEELFARSIRFGADREGRLRTLSWEDHLLHLCLHASFQHGFRQPGVNAWDARSIAGRPDFDLARFLSIARRPALVPWIFGGLSMSAALFPCAVLERALEELKPLVPARLARMARSFRPETLLAPGVDSVFGSPFARLSWSGFRLKTLSLLVEISRPRTAEARRSERPSIQRIWELTRNHGLAALRLASSRRPYLPMSPSPASLGEVRDV